MKAILLIAILWLWPSTAHAQRQTEAETGSNIPIPRRARIPEASDLTQADRGRITMAEFARCTIDRRSTGVAKLLTLGAHEIDAKLLIALADDECLAAGQLRFKVTLLGGSLFAELFRRRTAAMSKGEPWKMPITMFNSSAASDPTVSKSARAQLGLLTFAECVISRDPAAAKATVLAATASKDESVRFAAVVPNLGPCLYTGQQLTFSKSVLSGALGEVLYRNYGLVSSSAATGIK